MFIYFRAQVGIIYLLGSLEIVHVYRHTIYIYIYIYIYVPNGPHRKDDET